MMYIDLTHTIEEGMPVYPGTLPPKITLANTVAKDGFAEIKMTMFSHTGTHMDAPSHMIAGGKNLEDYPAAHFFGKALLMDISESIPSLESIKSLTIQEEGVEMIVIKTAWSQHWGTEKYFHGFPVLTPQHYKYLISQGIKCIALDAISVDPVGSKAFENHLTLLSQGVTIAENLTNLDKIPCDRFRLVLLPLKVKNSDGFSIRAIASLE